MISNDQRDKMPQEPFYTILADLTHVKRNYSFRNKREELVCSTILKRISSDFSFHLSHFQQKNVVEKGKSALFGFREHFLFVTHNQSFLFINVIF